MSRHLLCGALALTLLGAAAVHPAHACGDKFLVGARGAAFMARAAVTPAAILVYWNPPEDEEAGVYEAHMESVLEDVGHEVEVVHDSTTLYREAAARGYDLILMELEQARAERSRLDGVAPETTLLPFTAFPSRREYTTAKKEFGTVLKTPTTVSRLLAAVDQARSQGRR